MMKKDNFKRGKKYLVGILIIGVLVVGWVVWQGRGFEITFDEKGQAVVPEKHWYEGQRSYLERIVDWQEKLLEMQAQDDFGGATPEETFNGFVEALKQGDIGLASQYFVFNKQEQMFNELTVGEENGSIQDFLTYVEKIDGGKEYIKNYYRFTVVENREAIMSFDLKFNEDTQVWKMESL